MTTTTDDPNVEYHWNEWVVRHRTDNRSPRPWTVEHVGRRIATFATAELAKRSAQRCIREDNGLQTAVRWKQVVRNAPQQQDTSRQHTTPPPRNYGVNEAGQRVLEALSDFVAELLRDQHTRH